MEAAIRSGYDEPGRSTSLNSPPATSLPLDINRTLSKSPLLLFRRRRG
jgi:hypothetical protein